MSPTHNTNSIYTGKSSPPPRKKNHQLDTKFSVDTPNHLTCTILEFLSVTDEEEKENNH